VGLSTWRKKKTGDGDRRTRSVKGRRRPASSRDGASQKSDTLPTPCRDARRRRLQSLLFRHRWHVSDGMGKRRDGEDGGSAALWWGRVHALQLRKVISRSITALWLLTCRVAKGSRAPARVGAGNRRTIHAHVVRARPLAPPRSLVWFFLFLSLMTSIR
jgi:hypothetical protein